MNGAASALDWQAGFIAAAEAAERGLLALLAGLGLVGQIGGQPAWPFGHRIASELLALDRGLARSALETALALALAAVLFGVALKRRRAGWFVGAALLLAAAPWPDPGLVFASAHPASLSRRPLAFSAESVEQGRRIYQHWCVECHGDDARGEGPRAARWPMWPPDLDGALLWRRHDGDLFWAVMQGLHGRDGAATMPGFAQHLSADQAWQVLDFLRANAAGQSLRRDGAWTHPVRAPDFDVRCDGGAAIGLRHWAGQRLRIVVAGPDQATVREDPRFITVVLAAATAPVQAECVGSSEAARGALALIAGVPTQELDGAQFIVDRRGWLRARALAGPQAWSDADYLCHADARAPAGAGGLDGLIVRIDAEPVNEVPGGRVH